MRYSVLSIPHPQYNDQRLPLLIDKNNFSIPEPSSALWIWDLWLSGKFNTVEARARDLCVFYEFVSTEYSDFFSDAARLKTLSSRQVNQLTSFLLLNFNHNIEDHILIAPSTFNRRLDSIRSFLRFHYSRYIARVENIEMADIHQKRVDKLDALLKKKKYSTCDVENQTRQIPPLSPAEIEIIKLVIRPSSDDLKNEVNPFRTSLQVRNACLILLLIELGCRASELVLLRNNDLDLKLTHNATVVIQQSAAGNNLKRHRRDGASHKTRNRELPISPGLRDLIVEYIEDHRPKLRKPYRGQLTGYLFVSEHDGGAMTTSGLEYVVETIFNKTKGLADVITPHRFRVARMNELRESVDNKYANSNSPMIKAGDMQDTLTTWGGWTNTSSMPKRYTNAHLMRKINEYLAEKDTKKGPVDGACKHSLSSK